jgi:hypothetical protein
VESRFDYFRLADHPGDIANFIKTFTAARDQTVGHAEYQMGARSLDGWIVEAAFLAEHGIFWRFNPGAESRPSPPDQKQGEHNG